MATEWLETDGAGGFASGTVGFVRTRRYHALLLCATVPPGGRMVLVNGLEAWVGGQALSRQCYAPDVTTPDPGASFSPAPWPTWRFTLPDGTQIQHEILVHRAACETVLRWRRLAGQGACTLNVRLLISGRDYHALHRENTEFRFDPAISGGNVSWHPYPGVPAVSALTNGCYRHAPEWYRNFLYSDEQDRGLDYLEDLASPGVFEFSLLDDAQATIVLRTGDSIFGCAEDYAEQLAAAEHTSRASLAAPGVAAQAYLVQRGTGKTVIAGFPWFTDWGRDTFIAMRGLVLGRGDFATAEAILCAWAETVSEGMLPNRFPDQGATPEYNAVDASLWFIVAVHEFFVAGPAAGFAQRPTTQAVLQTACEAILHGYTEGTRFGIKADVDGLLRAGVPGVQLTWMDARTGDHVITPRIGKPVEVQALWINALRIAATHWSPAWETAAQQAQSAFATRFKNPEGGLFDVVDVDHVAGTADASVRPNQIFSVGGLPFAVLHGEAARNIVDTVEACLLTPLGLRSLSPADPRYIGRYQGGPEARDAAYHQGTVWPWLMGAFVEAWLSVRDGTQAARAEARARFLPPFVAHLEQAGLGHVSEIADGDAPHAPRGCPFQAWSLGEFLRLERILLF